MLPAEKSEILKKSLIFSSLNEEELSGLAGLSVERSFQPSEFIFWEGDEAKLKALAESPPTV